MEKTFYSKNGVETRELTQQEIEEHAADGDTEAMTVILKQEITAAKDIQEEVNAIKKFLGV